MRLDEMWNGECRVLLLRVHQTSAGFQRIIGNNDIISVVAVLRGRSFASALLNDVLPFPVATDSAAAAAAAAATAGISSSPASYKRRIDRI